MGMTVTFLRVSKDELKEYLENSELLEKRAFNDDIYEDDNFLDIGKSWDGISFLLTGSGAGAASGELSKIIFSEQFIDEEQDMGYGPAHYVNFDEVKSLNDKISKMRVEELREKFDAGKMTRLGIYPNVWERGEEEFSYLIEYFKKLQAFYKKAANENQAIISMIG